jgi:hypothetical protein
MEACAMNMIDLRFRQIHLDFHTSEAIPGIGAAFDPEDFAATLERARVTSITCFARCHHGWLYFDSQAFPALRHPHLQTNLLPQQIAACHARNIRVPIYVTIQWDHHMATQHPEWLIVDEHGCVVGTPPYEAGFYRKLCVNSPYRAFLNAHVQEILETLPTDGFFFDIVQPTACSCRYCRAAMEAQGLEPSHAADRWHFAVQTINAFKRDMTAFVRQFNQQCSIFYNAGHVGPVSASLRTRIRTLNSNRFPAGGGGTCIFRSRSAMRAPWGVTASA